MPVTLAKLTWPRRKLGPNAMRTILSAVILLGLTAAALADATENVGTRYRGTVEKRDGDLLTLRLHSGESLTLRMKDTTRLLTATPANIRDIKPESYLSAISTPECGSARRAETVTIYAPDLRGWFAGSRPWDTMASAVLTGGWIADLSDADPRRVVLSYEGGTTTLALPSDATATQITRGEKALLTGGAAVTAFVAPDEAGKPVAEIIAVGRRGATPNL